MATHSSIIAWRIPWTEEPGGLYSPWGRKESDMIMSLHFLCALLFITTVTLQDHDSVDGPKVTVAKTSLPYPQAKCWSRWQCSFVIVCQVEPLFPSLLSCVQNCFSAFLSPFCQLLSCGVSDPMDCSPPDSSVQGVLQARRLKWVAISFTITNSFSQLLGQLENF